MKYLVKLSIFYTWLKNKGLFAPRTGGCCMDFGRIDITHKSANALHHFFAFFDLGSIETEDSSKLSLAANGIITALKNANALKLEILQGSLNEYTTIHSSNASPLYPAPPQKIDNNNN